MSRSYFWRRSIQAEVADLSNEFTSFYQNLKIIKDHYRHLPNHLQAPFDPDFNDMDPEYEKQGGRI